MVTRKGHTLYPLFKQVFDAVAAFLLLLATAPILFVTAIAIKLDSKGPIIFKQRRVGKGEKEFTASARDQVWDYSLDLKNFHESSRIRRRRCVSERIDWLRGAFS